MEYKDVLRKIKDELYAGVNESRKPGIERALRQYSLPEREKGVLRDYASEVHPVIQKQQRAVSQAGADYRGRAEVYGIGIAAGIGALAGMVLGYLLDFSDSNLGNASVGIIALFAAEVLSQQTNQRPDSLGRHSFGGYLVRRRKRAESKPFEKEIMSLEEKVLKQLS